MSEPVCHGCKTNPRAPKSHYCPPCRAQKYIAKIPAFCRECKSPKPRARGQMYCAACAYKRECERKRRWRAEQKKQA